MSGILINVHELHLWVKAQCPWPESHKAGTSATVGLDLGVGSPKGMENDSNPVEMK